MCEFCHKHPHDCRCPNAPEPKVRGYCLECSDELRGDYEYYTDNDGNEFCSDDCALKYHVIQSKEWEEKEDD